MAKQDRKHSHPGNYIRQNVIPQGMTVTDAAKQLDVGRPALSNFLNGNAALSSNMAVRLERAFGADRQGLLEMQVAYDQHEQRASEKVIAVGTFVPNILTIKARQIENWADKNLDARSHLPVLLRTLVHSTGRDLSKVDFPGYDNAQRKGNDGLVESGASTPWIPKGKSYWEFGTDQNPRKKAEDDYSARLSSVDPTERAKCTYVSVTPRNWPGKIAWENQANEAGDWKAVRAFDASDLEQWLEQSAQGQIWLTEQLDEPASGFETLEEAWRRWANASEPHLIPELFEPSITEYRSTLKEWLENPKDKPFVISADSKDEALAFLSCLFDDEELHQYKDLVVVFNSPPTLRKLLSSSVNFIPIVHSQDVERVLANNPRSLPCIVFRPRNAVDAQAEISPNSLGYIAFEKALTAMGIEEGSIGQLARESGHSPTILRRRLTNIPAIKTPEWAGNDDTARALLPIALVGAWHADSESDREIVFQVADKKYEEIEKNVAHLLQFDDSPVWTAGGFQGVVSKIDAIFAVAERITPQDLNRFFIAAEYVLSESDPAIDLPEEDRWAAALYGKTRNHSGALREGICESLVILSVHGNHLFQARFGMDVESRIAGLIRRLMTPLTQEKFFSQKGDLPRYAEAAPNEFLKIIEEDLQLPDSVILGDIRSSGTSPLFESPIRTYLLWGLECLAWNPKNLARVVKILAQLSEIKLEDNWGNKPGASLQAIFRSWMPQTAATLEQRIKLLETLIKRSPDVGWEVCMAQIRLGPRTGMDSFKPNWRNDATGAGNVLVNKNNKEIFDFERKALDLLIAWKPHNENTLGGLVECLQVLIEEDENKIWDLINEWSRNADEPSKAILRERIRRSALTRRGKHRQLGKATKDRAREAYENLQATDPVIRHGWLFAGHWVEESAEEIEEEEIDFQKRDERIDKLRREAMFGIWKERGFEGVKELLAGSGAESTVGRYVLECVVGIKPQAEIIRHILSLDKDLRGKVEGFLQGFLFAIDDEPRNKVLRETAKKLPPAERVRLFVCAPVITTTWRLLDDFDEKTRVGYWENVSPFVGRYDQAELTELIDRLLEVVRPRAAFHAIHLEFKDLETSRLKRLMREVVTVNAEPADHFRLDPYYISEALNSLEGRAGVSREEMAHLEFLFIEALDRSEHGIPNLESQISESPALFIQAVALAFKRSDEGEDPPEWNIQTPEQREVVARAAYNLLEQFKRIPGTDEDGKIDAKKLAVWLTKARKMFLELARADVGDHQLGQLLAKSPEGENGIWPCEAVCEAMEEIASKEIGRGFDIGVYNSRGVHIRGKGGEQERDLSAKYRAWAEQLHFDYPYVGGLLEEIATSYDKDAERQDSEATINYRLRY